MITQKLALAALIWAATCTTQALDIPGADGSDGPFAPTTNIEVDLGAAQTGTWNGVNRSPGKGVYDAEKWAVVYRFTTVNIPENVTVTFKNNAARAPVVFLVSGQVSIRGQIMLHGRYVGGKLAEPGPGGFRGGPGNNGQGLSHSPGFGPGRDFRNQEAGGSYASPGGYAVPDTVYGNSQVVPLVGGSGGFGSYGDGRLGGAGGGAILIAATGTIAIDGAIVANGGTSPAPSFTGGSGGAIRLIGDRVTGRGGLSAIGSGCCSQMGGIGRLRIETFAFDNELSLAPVTQAVAPDEPVLLWPTAEAPSARIVSVGSKIAPADPKAALGAQAGGNADITLDGPGIGEVLIETTNLPPSAKVILKATILHGGGADMQAVFIAQQGNKATWRVGELPFHLGYCTLQVVARAQ